MTHYISKVGGGKRTYHIPRLYQWVKWGDSDTDAVRIKVYFNTCYQVNKCQSWCYIDPLQLLVDPVRPWVRRFDFVTSAMTLVSPGFKMHA